MKEKIAQVDAKASDPTKQKLIHSGKILSNDQTIAGSAVKDGDFLVLMVSSAITATKPKPVVVEQPAAAAVVAAAPPVPATASVPAPAISAPAAPVSPPEDLIKNIEDMGFPREEVIRALQASFNNPDRAVEYLTNGIPEGAFEAEDADAGHINIPVATEADEAAMAANPLSFLRQVPQFAQLRLVVQQNPRLLGPLIEQISQSNPEIFQMISENQEAFMELIQAPLTEAEISELSSAAQMMSHGDDGSDEEGDEEDDGAIAQDPTTTIQVTEDEKAAIDRLMALGFDRARAIEAFFACDKNETIAANFLFEHQNDEDF